MQKRKKLSLSIETIRVLDANDLERVVGGMRNNSQSYVYSKCGSACTSADSCTLNPCC